MNPYGTPAAQQSLPGQGGPAHKMSMKNLLFSGQGRIPRSTWWITLLIVGVLNLIIFFGMVSTTLFSLMSENYDAAKDAIEQAETGTTATINPEDAKAPSMAPVFLGFLAMIPLLWICFALHAKRWHDRGKSGWLAALAIIPFVNLWLLIECGFLRGTVGPNQYGPDPLNGQV